MDLLLAFVFFFLSYILSYIIKFIIGKFINIDFKKIIEKYNFMALIFALLMLPCFAGSIAYGFGLYFTLSSSINTIIKTLLLSIICNLYMIYFMEIED